MFLSSAPIESSVSKETLFRSGEQVDWHYVQVHFQHFNVCISKSIDLEIKPGLGANTSQGKKKKNPHCLLTESSEPHTPTSGVGIAKCVHFCRDLTVTGFS